MEKNNSGERPETMGKHDSLLLSTCKHTLLVYTVPIESLHALSKFSPFVASYPEIKLHQNRLFPPLFTHHNTQLPSEKQIQQISEN